MRGRGGTGQPTASERGGGEDGDTLMDELFGAVSPGVGEPSELGAVSEGEVVMEGDGDTGESGAVCEGEVVMEGDGAGVLVEGDVTDGWECGSESNSGVSVGKSPVKKVEPPSFPGLMTASGKKVEPPSFPGLMTASGKKVEPPSFPGLMTASGKKVTVSSAALSAVRDTLNTPATARKTLNTPATTAVRDTLNTPPSDTASTVRDSLNSPASDATGRETPSAGNNTLCATAGVPQSGRPLPTLMTAGGREVFISEAALRKVRETAATEAVPNERGVPNETGVPNEAGVPIERVFLGLQTAAGTRVAVSATALAAVRSADLCTPTSDPCTLTSATLSDGRAGRIRPQFRPLSTKPHPLSAKPHPPPTVRYRPVFRRGQQAPPLPSQATPTATPTPPSGDRHTLRGLLTTPEGPSFPMM